ncbi:TIGR03619 family F420-dependent LLM class oxidoreductase [Nocardia barduliensis]|uniref:TIGR03619 family F420-dependent LLM class oxidoreductase n=1 Tax=Nocardia barduliensis TaxID=2736643 RepID=UPI0015733613|nr:TIGR03619 family F420-dependent LLM class oxidoreductase [Nocardia barduliensis]
MKYALEYPSELPTAPDDFLRPAVIQDVVTHAEAAGFSAVALSEHPAPSRKWRDNGGHNTLDPIAALSYIAGVTARLRLMTNLYVLPFRNPYLSAKALSSLDIVSGGRLIAGVGAGYLRSEFGALGVEHGRRAELLDEALGALRRIWTEPGTPIAGKDFAAVGPMWLQPPNQQRVPLWLGGNGKAAIRRIAEHGDGWMPIIAGAEMAAAMRTEAIENVDQFGAAVNRMRHQLAAAGRDPDFIDVQVPCPTFDIGDSESVRRARDFIDDVERRGATWVLLHVDGSSPQAATRFIDTVAKAVIDR